MTPALLGKTELVCLPPSLIPDKSFAKAIQLLNVCVARRKRLHIHVSVLSHCVKGLNPTA